MKKYSQNLSEMTNSLKIKTRHISIRTVVERNNLRKQIFANIFGLVKIMETLIHWILF